MTVSLKKRVGKKGTSLFLKWWANDKWNYEFLKLRLIGDKARDKETQRLAEKLRLNREEEMESMGRGTAPAHKRKMTFMKYYETINKEDHNWRLCHKHLQEFPGNRVCIGNVNESWAAQFRDFLLERLSTNSAHLIYSIFKAALNRAVKDRIITLSPARLIEGIRTKETEIEYLTQAELEALAATPYAPDPEMRRAFLFCCYTGLRFSDVQALKWENYKDGRLKFRQKKTGGFEYLPIPPEAKIWMGENEKMVNFPHIFNLKSGVTINNSLRNWAKVAGLEKHLHFHMSRHTCATWLLGNGVDLYTVSKILGHANISTTQRYAKVTDAKIAEAMNRLPSIIANAN